MNIIILIIFNNIKIIKFYQLYYVNIVDKTLSINFVLLTI